MCSSHGEGRAQPAPRQETLEVISSSLGTLSTSPGPSRCSSPVQEASPTLAPDSITQLSYELGDSDAFRAISAPTSSELMGALGALFYWRCIAHF